MEPTAGRAGREAPKPPAMTPVVGARFTRVVHREWGRSTVRPLASALSWLRFVLFFLFSLVFQFVHSIRFVRHSFFGSRKEPRIHITILHKYMPLLALAKGFNKRCFFRSRVLHGDVVSCRHRTGKLGLGWATNLGVIQLPRVRWRLLACQNGASPDCIIAVVVLFFLLLLLWKCACVLLMFLFCGV